MKDALPFFVGQMLSSDFTGALDYNNSRLVMNSWGEIQFYNLSDGKSWSIEWSAPVDPCSEYNMCGKFGVCNAKETPMCKCPHGFNPVSLQDWDAGLYIEGCERVSALCSQKRTFLNILLVRVGGDVKAFDQAQNEASCREMCLDECKCQAYYFKDVDGSGRGTESTRKCWIWMCDVENLHQDSTDGSIRLSLHVSEGNLLHICQISIVNFYCLVLLTLKLLLGSKLNDANLSALWHHQPDSHTLTSKHWSQLW